VSILDCHRLATVYFYALYANLQTQILDLLGCKRTLYDLQCNTGFLQDRQNDVQVQQVLFECGRINDNVFQVGKCTLKRTVDNITSTGLWKVAGAVFSPNGRRKNGNKPRCDVKAVFSLPSSETLIFQYPELASRVESIWPPPTIRGSLQCVEMRTNHSP
jgi:hypothetical protein